MIHAKLHISHLLVTSYFYLEWNPSGNISGAMYWRVPPLRLRTVVITCSLSEDCLVTAEIPKSIIISPLFFEIIKLDGFRSLWTIF